MKNGKKRRAWTSVQVRELKSMARRKAPAAKIAKKLKRSEGATRQKAFSIGLSLELASLTGRSLKIRFLYCSCEAPPRTRAGLCF